MVKANITNWGFDITGHADYDDNGYDVVCAGISALSQSIALALNKHCKVNAKATNGWLTVELKEPSPDSLLLLDTLRLGLLEIEKEYPNHIQVRVQRGVFK